MTLLMTNICRRAAALVVCLAIAGTAQAGGILNTAVLDQSQTLSNAAFVLGSSTVSYAQTFTQGSSAILDRIVVPMNNVGGLVTLRLYAGSLPAIGSAALLGTASNATGTFDLSGTSIALTAGSAYTFVLTGGSGSFSGADTDPYAGGRLGYLFNGAGFYADAARFDMAFQTFDRVAPVAEPATLAVLGIGLVGLGYVRSRRGRGEA